MLCSEPLVCSFTELLVTPLARPLLRGHSAQWCSELFPGGGLMSLVADTVRIWICLLSAPSVFLLRAYCSDPPLSRKRASP